MEATSNHKTVKEGERKRVKIKPKKQKTRQNLPLKMDVQAEFQIKIANIPKASK